MVGRADENTGQAIEAFLQKDSECRLGDGWRAELVGTAAERIASGRAAVAFDGHGGLILVDR